MTAPSTLPGMGSVPLDGRTLFRVWAKFAKSVHVAGSFNNWSNSGHPLAPEGNGYWSAEIPGVGAGDKYRYFITSPFVPLGQWRTDPYCKNVEDNYTGDGVVVDSLFDWGNDPFSMPSWNELVIYELHTASFNRGSEIPGDFSSILAKLDYLQELGINAIEILPIFGIPKQFSLGYNPALPFDIKSNYGSVEDFKKFVKAAHSKGIAIILDIVLNHFGPEDLDTSLWRTDGWHENGKNGIYFYNDWKSETEFGDRPDYGRPEVRDFLKDNAMMWLDEYHIDGLRFDSTVNIRNVRGRGDDPGADIAEGWGLMQWINNEIDARMPWKITIAEDLQDNKWVTRDTRAGGAGFDSQWDSYFYWRLFSAVTSADDGGRDMYALRDAITHRLGKDQANKVIYFNNHDECAEINDKFRLTDRIWFGNTENVLVKRKYCLAAAVLFTSPGIPLIFMGDEFYECGAWRDSGTVDWSKRDRFTGIWDLFQSLIRLRRNWFNNTGGLKGQHVNVFHTNNNEKVIAYHRWADGGMGDDVVVAANFSNRYFQRYDIGFPRPGIWKVRFNSDWQGYSEDFSSYPGYDTTASAGRSLDNMPNGGTIGIGPYSLLIFSQ